MPGYTRVPNDFFDIIPRLTDPELRVLLLIYRRTIGWNKDDDQISLTQFQDGTGIRGRQHIIAALRGLEEQHLVHATRNGTRTARYQLVTESDQRLVTLRDQQVVTQRDPQKTGHKDTSLETAKTWEAVKVQLAAAMSPTNYRTWIRDASMVHYDGRNATIACPAAHQVLAIRERMLPLIARAFEDVTGQRITCEVIATQEGTG